MENEEIKINCTCAEELMGEYIDGELSAQKKAALESHLSSCERCRKDFEKLEKTVALLGDAAKDVPEELYGSVMAKIGSNKKRKTVLWRRLGTVCAAAFVFVAASVYMLPKFAGEADNMAAEGYIAEDASYYSTNSNSKSLDAVPGEETEDNTHIVICSFSSDAEIASFDQKNSAIKITDVQAGALALTYDGAYDLRSASRVYLEDIFGDIEYLNEYIKDTYAKESKLAGDENFEFSARGVNINGTYVIPWKMIPDESIEKYMLDKTPMIIDHIIDKAEYETVIIK